MTSSLTRFLPDTPFDRRDFVRGLGVISYRGWESTGYGIDAAGRTVTDERADQAHIDGDALVSAAGQRYCLKHPAYQLHDEKRCIRCEEIEAWLQSPILYE